MRKHLFAVLNSLLLISAGSLELSGQTCSCEVPTQTGLEGGKNYKYGATSAVVGSSNLNDGLVAAVANWQGIEEDNPSLPQITIPSLASRSITFDIVDKEQFKIDHPEFAPKINSNTDAFFYTSGVNGRIVFFADRDPQNWSQARAHKIVAHELGHAHGLGHATATGCTQGTTVMTLTTDYSASYAIAPTSCDDEGADRAFPPPPSDPGGGSATCEEGEENINPDGCGSPIIISLSTNRFELTDWEGGVFFDLDSNGVPEQLSWTAAGSDEAFLTLDRNGNGYIDDGTELFGNFSPQPPSAFPNGFLALSLFDDPAVGGDGDGWITAADEVFADLRLWIDSNHDGFSQPDELASLGAAGISAIDLTYRESRRVDRHGNSFRYTSAVLLTSDPPLRRRWQGFAVDVFLLTGQ